MGHDGPVDDQFYKSFDLLLFIDPDGDYLNILITALIEINHLFLPLMLFRDILMDLLFDGSRPLEKLEAFFGLGEVELEEGSLQSH